MSVPEPAPPPGPEPAASLRTDPVTGLQLPDPFPEYIRCPHCGEAEVEAWCYQDEVRCHNCGAAIAHRRPPGCGAAPFCRRGMTDDGRRATAGGGLLRATKEE